MMDGFTASEIQTGETSIFVRSSGDGLVHGRRIACPILALWGAGGPLDTWYVEEGGPLAPWRTWGDDDVRRHALDAGHFFPEEAPEQTAEALNGFFGAERMK